MVRQCTALCIWFKASNNPPCIERDGSERERERAFLSEDREYNKRGSGLRGEKHGGQ